MRFIRWFTRSGLDPEVRAPTEAIVLRCFGLVALALFVPEAFTTAPRAGLHGRGVVVLGFSVGMVLAGIATRPRNGEVPIWQRIAALLAVSACGGVLAAVQPDGSWQVAAYYVGVMAALRLPRREGLATVVVSIVAMAIVAGVAGKAGQVPSVTLGALPWFLMVRLMRELRDQRDALTASRAAEARAAAAAERGRIAREMHDVLAHSLSALALQLESTRLLARDRGVDEDVARAVDRAHYLAAGGLQEARRAIAAARGDELPGPERIGALADAFGEQSGLPVAVEVRGEPRELPPEKRLAMYRTAQEALTNVRRHATAERVELKLDYLPDRTVLVVEDHAITGAPAPAALGLTGGGYGLTGMRERAELLGGELLAAPTPHGFRVELRLPASE
ncbi:MAG TPA: histidine kinase [Solirubrobacteraceae bacterium]|nr:histidine kinase [Solirubrobacteraceae bacterium]